MASAAGMITKTLTAVGRRHASRADGDFDVLGDRFDAMYGTSWGRVRLAVLWDHMLTAIPEIRHGGARVLDAGGGGGRIAIKLAELGNRVVLCDPSREMLGRAETAIREAELTDAITVAHARIQDLEPPDVPFDVITCHGVLEWLAEPRAALEQLVRCLRPDGRLSLMFSNRNGWLLKQLIRGDLRAGIVAAAPAGHAERRRFAQLKRRAREQEPSS